MPIYEYACHHCRMVYQFFSKTLETASPPTCPKCGAEELERVLSSFGVITSSKTRDTDGGDRSQEAEPGEGGPGDMDDPFAKMSPSQQAAAEREMMKLMDQAEGIDENDPRQMGHFMERMAQITGIEDSQMNEAIRRLKDGEDPEKIEEDMGDILGMDEGADHGGMGGYGHDPGLYDM